FALGQKLAQLGAAYLSSVDLVREFHDACSGLPSWFGETVQLAVLDELDAVYLARRDGTHPVRLSSEPGRHLPASCTAVGKAMLALLTPDELESRLAGIDRLPMLTARSLATPAELLTAVEQVRSAGYALDDEEAVEGVLCVAGALRTAESPDAVAAVSFTLLR